MNWEADYVITAENYEENQFPNNVVAHEANEILKNFNDMVYMPLAFQIPEGVTIRVLSKEKFDDTD